MKAYVLIVFLAAVGRMENMEEKNFVDGKDKGYFLSGACPYSSHCNNGCYQCLDTSENSPCYDSSVITYCTTFAVILI